MEETDGALDLEGSAQELNEEDTPIFYDKLISILLQDHKSIRTVLNVIFSRIEVTSCSVDKICLGKFRSSEQKVAFISALECAVNALSNNDETYEEKSAILRRLSESLDKMEFVRELSGEILEDSEYPSRASLTDEEDRPDDGIDKSGIASMRFLYGEAAPSSTDHNYNLPANPYLNNGFENEAKSPLFENRHICPFCNVTVNCLTRLLLHRRHCRRNPSRQCNVPHRCSTCQQVFNGKSEYMRHFHNVHRKRGPSRKSRGRTKKPNGRNKSASVTTTSVQQSRKQYKKRGKSFQFATGLKTLSDDPDIIVLN